MRPPGRSGADDVETPCLAANARYSVLGQAYSLGSSTEDGGFRHGCADVPGWSEDQDTVIVVGEQMVCVETAD